MCFFARPGGGTSAPSVFYYYINLPFLTGAVPDQGPLGGGNTVTLSGTNLLTVTPGQTAVGASAELPETATGMIGLIGPVTQVTAVGALSQHVYRSDLIPATEWPRAASQSSSHGRRRVPITSGILFDSVIPNPWSPIVHVMASAASGIRHDPLATSRHEPGGPAGAPTSAPDPSAKRALATTFGGSQP